MAQTVYVASLTLMDGNTVKIPILQITSYSELWEYAPSGVPPYSPVHQFKQTNIMLNNNQMVVVQETAANVQAAITAATDVGPV